MNPREYAGRSLAYVRTLLGLQARYATASEAWANVPDKHRYPGRPAEGDVCYYATVLHAYGNIALADRNGYVRTVDMDGNDVRTAYDDPALGHYVGCSDHLGEQPVNVPTPPPPPKREDTGSHTEADAAAYEYKRGADQRAYDYETMFPSRAEVEADEHDE